MSRKTRKKQPVKRFRLTCTEVRRKEFAARAWPLGETIDAALLYVGSGAGLKAKVIYMAVQGREFAVNEHAVPYLEGRYAKQSGAQPLDSTGVPWDARLHASSKGKTKNGKWKIRRGVDKVERSNLELELKAAAPPPCPEYDPYEAKAVPEGTDFGAFIRIALSL